MRRLGAASGEHAQSSRRQHSSSTLGNWLRLLSAELDALQLTPVRHRTNAIAQLASFGAFRTAVFPFRLTDHGPFSLMSLDYPLDRQTPHNPQIERVTHDAASSTAARRPSAPEAITGTRSTNRERAATLTRHSECTRILSGSCKNLMNQVSSPNPIIETFHGSEREHTVEEMLGPPDLTGGSGNPGEERA